MAPSDIVSLNFLLHVGYTYRLLHIQIASRHRLSNMHGMTSFYYLLAPITAEKIFVMS